MTRSQTRQSGVTLVELMVVVAIIAVLLGIAAPGVKALMKAFRSEDAVLRTADTALQTARTLAMERGRYVGVRFQKRDSLLTLNGDEADGFRRLLEAPQSMMFIEHRVADTDGSTAEFRTIEEYKPIDLCTGYSVMAGEFDDDMDDPNLVRSATTFTVLFSPAGRLFVGNVQLKGNAPWVLPRSDFSEAKGGTAFLADEEKEQSVQRFWVCHNQDLTRTLGRAIDDGDIKTYLENQAPTCVYVKPFGGTLIVTDPEKIKP